MIRTVLVPLDGSAAAETVLPYVELVASRTGATVHLLTVVREEEEASQVGETFAYLEKKGEELHARSFSFTTEAIAGDEAQVILSQAEKKSADLIAMSTHGRSGLMRWVLGSVATKLVHGTSRPLLLVRAREPQERALASVDRVVVPLDGSELCLSVLPFVEEMAAALGADLVLYNAVPPLDIYPGTELTPARAGGIIDDLLGQGRSFLAQVAGEIEARGKVKARSVVTIGFPVDEIVRVAEEVNAGLIAMATHGRSGVNRWVMGSVADGVVRRSSLPCLLVRPEQASQERT
jgi:nucleotide-binding universal stress UspA family protein